MPSAQLGGKWFERASDAVSETLSNVWGSQHGCCSPIKLLSGSLTSRWLVRPDPAGVLSGPETPVLTASHAALYWRLTIGLLAGLWPRYPWSELQEDFVDRLKLDSNQITFLLESQSQALEVQMQIYRHWLLAQPSVGNRPAQQLGISTQMPPISPSLGFYADVCLVTYIIFLSPPPVELEALPSPGKGPRMAVWQWHWEMESWGVK